MCNQTAWHCETGEYLFETFFKRGNLKRVFIPEHGLFGELQDQEKLDGTGLYSELEYGDCEFLSLYGSNESSLTAESEKLTDLDSLIIDLQDIGVRYYTFLSTLRNLFIVLKKAGISIPVWIVDHENPAGPWVEGSMLAKGYGSFIGIEGLPHRHGLTLGEMACFFYDEISADFTLNVVLCESNSRNFPWIISPSPNIPGFFTCGFYSGQCLWEGTNVSEGRGTTRPFEVFGAPWMDELVNFNKKAGFKNWNDPEHPFFNACTALRWHRFIPAFHKYKGECCYGFQLIRRFQEKPYHALLHNLGIISFIRKNCDGFAFRPGKYEAGNEKTAIELLAGDPFILEYLSEENPNLKNLGKYFYKTENAWIEKAKKYRIYRDPLISTIAAIQ